MVAIKEHREETPSIRTMRLDGKMQGTAGQFVMVWVPGIDEFPMSLSYAGDGFGITYQILGDGTKALAAKKVGDKIGIRGPYGKAFALHGKNLLLVAGGAGMVPLALLAEEAIEHRCSVTVVIGARTARELLFETRTATAGAKIHISTDDGSKGFKGFATDLTKSVVAKEQFDSLYACGPERMIVGLLEAANERGLPMQASLERIMKCGIGLCDSCALDGKHVCTDGPVFKEAELRRFVELGKTKLDLSGRKIPV